MTRQRRGSATHAGRNWHRAVATQEGRFWILNFSFFHFNRRGVHVIARTPKTIFGHPCALAAFASQVAVPPRFPRRGRRRVPPGPAWRRGVSWAPPSRIYSKGKPGWVYVGLVIGLANAQ
jgi:hypothetical protein